ncbi:MAG: fluoride efflux transporter CrcB [Tissierellia bacterium]|nr:fluoride efflux transporter CrcB [Tissierellia bacterium]
MDKIIAVAIGGSIGAVGRYLIGLIPMKMENGFPLNTFIINVIGAFVIGLISATALKNTGFNKNLELFLKTGLCGGFTTFSTFSLESFNLLQSGNFITSIIYIILSLTISLLAIVLAYSLIK